MLVDRTPGNDTLHPVQILGSNAHLPLGPFRMAALLRRPVVFMTGLYMGGNRYAIHFDHLADFSAVARDERDAVMQAAIIRYAELLDQYCRRPPTTGLIFSISGSPHPLQSLRHHDDTALFPSASPYAARSPDADTCHQSSRRLGY
jgi:hypothetical protein